MVALFVPSEQKKLEIEREWERVRVYNVERRKVEFSKLNSKN